MSYDYIKTLEGQTLGSIETLSNGDQVARTFTGQILGYYRKSQDWTTYFDGRVFTRGNTVSALIVKAAGK